MASKMARNSADSWILDSGAMRHITNNRSMMISYMKLRTPVRIKLGDGHPTYAKGIGRVYLEAMVNNER